MNRHPASDVVGRLLWVGVALGALAGGAEFVLTRVAHGDISAPQLAALAAASLVWAVVPYVLARAWDETTRPWGVRHSVVHGAIGHPAAPPEPMSPMRVAALRKWTRRGAWAALVLAPLAPAVVYVVSVAMYGSVAARSGFTDAWFSGVLKVYTLAAGFVAVMAMSVLLMPGDK
jgi:hypothetical protein